MFIAINWISSFTSEKVWVCASGESFNVCSSECGLWSALFYWTQWIKEKWKKPNTLFFPEGSESFFQRIIINSLMSQGMKKTPNILWRLQRCLCFLSLPKTAPGPQPHTCGSQYLKQNSSKTLLQIRVQHGSILRPNCWQL